MSETSVDAIDLLSDRARSMDGSGAKLLFELQETIPDLVDLSIGQPDFDVPASVKEAAVAAIRSNQNGYAHPKGIPPLREKLRGKLAEEFPGWGVTDGGASEVDVMVTSGVTGGLVLAFMACIGPGDEVLVPEPYFMSYPHLARVFGGTPVYVDTYPDFNLTAERIERHVTPRTKLLLLNSPANPTGAVVSPEACREIAELAERKGFLVVADEVYGDFRFGVDGRPGRAPSAAGLGSTVLLLRGLSKSCAVTGWRIGFAAGPRAVIDKMSELALLFYVCAPSVAQFGALAGLDVRPRREVDRYRRNRDAVVAALSSRYRFVPPAGAFYAFLEVPEALGLTGTQFVTRALFEAKTLLVPGSAFSRRDTHFRLSFACDERRLARGLDVLRGMADAAQPALETAVVS
jgi:aspartate/methionine/tyrosine aminotransferase